MADGGEGTVEAFLASTPGAVPRSVVVEGPDGRPVSARWALLPPGAAAHDPSAEPGATAVLEIAQTSGLGLMDGRRPLEAHTRGLGQALAAALDAGASRVLVGLGGSATSDGGAGALQWLGARLLTSHGRAVAPGNAGLGGLDRVDLTGLRPLPPGGVTMLTDVRGPLLGERGAARVFAPQKGASPAQVETIERNLARFVGCAAESRPDAVALAASPGAGAAGGTGFGLGLWGAGVRPGAEEVGARLGLTEAVADADLVITGEGRFDAQTAEGKVAAHVASVARGSGVPVALVAGIVAVEPDGFDAYAELASLAGSAAASSADAARWARRAGRLLAVRRG
jgi:glycerate kinase